ncbi:hypothetical protein MTR67_012497 [Solanum verrucosum]|uniref:Uncharacterized protein n=1 Tax=Solanum verrucosum TaxID=315347 RepID=A0AAF0Q9X6_SOLVR|nr:hypothetical protein MTR67_012497 [Solanum verrucosum]
MARLLDMLLGNERFTRRTTPHMTWN